MRVEWSGHIVQSGLQRPPAPTGENEVLPDSRNVDRMRHAARRFIEATLMVSLLAGCGTTMKEGKESALLNVERSDVLFENVGYRAPNVSVVDAPGSAATGTRDDANAVRTSRFPASLETPNAVRLVSRQPIGLGEILFRLADLTGIPHVVHAGPDQDPVPVGERASARALPGGAGRIPPAFGLGGKYPANLSGGLPEILDRIAASYGLAWQYDGKTVHFRQFVTRGYQIAALPSRSEFSGSVGRTDSRGTIDLPAEISATLATLVGPEARMSFAASSGLLHLTARPVAHRRVAKYVRELNDVLGRQVVFDVNVLTVTSSRNERYGLLIDLLGNGASGNTLLWSGSHPVAGATGLVNVGLFSGDLGLDLLIEALDRQGDVTVETRTGATTSNNQIVPIQVVSDTTYVKKVEAVAGSNGQARTTIEPGTLTTGFEMQLLPRILNDRKILLRYGISISDLNEIASFTSDNQSVQLPTVSTTSFEQQAFLNDGETLVLAGFERDRTSLERPGTGLGSRLFGSRVGADVERTATVLTIRPRILDGRQESVADARQGDTNVE